MSTTFSHLDAGRSPHHWDPLIARLRRLRPPPPPGNLVVVAAHPDDETLGAGGLIATAAAAGVAVTVVVASDGEASHPHSPTHSPARLAERRRAEVREAVTVLAPRARVRRLGLPDGRLGEHIEELSEAVALLGSAATLLVSPWWGDGHPDHAACARAAAVAADRTGATLWQYPIWAWHWDARLTELADSMGVLPLGQPAVLAKRAAVACHASQHRPLSGAPGDEPVLAPAFLAHFARADEVFVVETAGQSGYFERLYRADADPWDLAGRFYERRKREQLMAALPRPRFGRAFEPGCATGLLTLALAQRCDELVAWDVADSAVAQARARTAGASAVQVERGRIPGQWPAGRFDLVVLSEVGYYCANLDALVRRVDGTLAADGVLVACHWRRDAPLHPHTADAVHEALGRHRHRLVAHDEADFRLDVWTGTGRSVAQLDGIVA